MKESYEQIHKQKKLYSAQIDQYMNIDNLSIVAQDLAERDMCLLDSAVVNKKKEGVFESDILYVNSLASMPQLMNKQMKQHESNHRQHSDALQTVSNKKKWIFYQLLHRH